MRIEEHQGRAPIGTSEEILGEIREFCRATQTAEVHLRPPRRQ